MNPSKKILTILFLLLQMLGFSQTFELTYKDPYNAPHCIIEKANNEFIMAFRKENNILGGDIFFAILNKNGRIMKENRIKSDDSSAFHYIKKIFPTDSGFICFGIRGQSKKIDLWISILSKDFKILKEEYHQLPQKTYIGVLDVIKYKNDYVYTGCTTVLPELNVSNFAGVVKIDKNNINIKQKINYKKEERLISLIAQDSTFLLLGVGLLHELNDTLGYLRSSSKFITPFFGQNGNVLKFSDTQYLIAGQYLEASGNRYVGIIKYQYPFNKVGTPFVFGKKDTLNAPALHVTADFYTPNNIYLGGQYNHFGLKNGFMLANVDKDLKQNWQKYYGGDTNYFLQGILATSDGGCLMYGSKDYTVDNEIKSGIYLLKVNSQGQLLAADGTPLPEENIKIFPNPARDILTISASDSEAKLTIQCFDNQGRSVYLCNFNRFTQINVSEWQRGLYHCVIRDKNGMIVKTEKVMVGL